MCKSPYRRRKTFPFPRLFLSGFRVSQMARRVSARLLPDFCQTSARLLTDFCQTSARFLPDYCRTLLHWAIICSRFLPISADFCRFLAQLTGYPEQISARLAATIQVKKQSTIHPQIIVTGPPYEKPYPYRPVSPIRTEMVEKPKAKLAGGQKGGGGGYEGDKYEYVGGDVTHHYFAQGPQGPLGPLGP